jgi:cytochrome c oxidase subunit 3
MSLDIETDTLSEVQNKKISHDGGFDGGDFDDAGGRGGGGGDGGDHGGRIDPSSVVTSSISPDVFGVLIFIASEIVLFLGMVIIFALARAGHPEWPPFGQPRLPLLISSLNTIILLVSGFTMYRAWRFIRDGYIYAFEKQVFITTILGLVFLVFQGFEWINLIRFGLKANLYGATFYVLIGMHALHVLIAVQILIFIWRKALGGAYTTTDHSGLIMGGLFWEFVILVWPILFIIVYLA